MLFRTALCTTAALLLAAGSAAAEGTTLDPRPATDAAPVDAIKVGEEVGFVFQVDLGAVPGSTYVEGLPGELPAAPLRASAGRQEDEAPADPAEDEVVVDDVMVEEEENTETVIVDEDGIEGEDSAYVEDQDGYVEDETVEEVPEETDPEQDGAGTEGWDESGDVSTEEETEIVEEEAPPAAEDEEGSDGAEDAGGA